MNCTKIRLAAASVRTRWGSYSALPDPLSVIRGGEGGKGGGKELGIVGKGGRGGKEGREGVGKEWKGKERMGR